MRGGNAAELMCRLKILRVETGDVSDALGGSIRLCLASKVFGGRGQRFARVIP
jgi:hypothetical protein